MVGWHCAAAARAIGAIGPTVVGVIVVVVVVVATQPIILPMDCNRTVVVGRCCVQTRTTCDRRKC